MKINLSIGLSLLALAFWGQALARDKESVRRQVSANEFHLRRFLAERERLESEFAPLKAAQQKRLRDLQGKISSLDALIRADRIYLNAARPASPENGHAAPFLQVRDWPSLTEPEKIAYLRRAFEEMASWGVHPIQPASYYRQIIDSIDSNDFKLKDRTLSGLLLHLVYENEPQVRTAVDRMAGFG